MEPTKSADMSEAVRRLALEAKQEDFADLVGVPIPSEELTNIDLAKEELRGRVRETKDYHA